MILTSSSKSGGASTSSSFCGSFLSSGASSHLSSLAPSSDLLCSPSPFPNSSFYEEKKTFGNTSLLFFQHLLAGKFFVLYLKSVDLCPLIDKLRKTMRCFGTLQYYLHAGNCLMKSPIM